MDDPTHTPAARPRLPIAVAILALASVFLSVAVGSTAAAPVGGTGDDGPPGPCALARRDGEDVRSFSKRLIRCAVAHWPVRGGIDKAICVAKRESGLIPRAISADGRYLGLYQHAKRYWPARYEATTKPEWRLENDALNGRSASVVTIRMVHRGGRHGWDPWRGHGCAID
jgi:hypothetical protein